MSVDPCQPPATPMHLHFNLLLLGVDVKKLKSHVSEDTVTRAVYTYLFLNESQKAVAKFFLVHQSTVSRWVKQYFAGLDPLVNSPETSNTTTPRSNATPLHIQQYIRDLVKEDPLTFLREVTYLVQIYHDFSISVSTVHRILIKHGFTCKKVTTIMRRAKVTLIRRFEWKLASSVGILYHRQLLFVDELSFRPEHFNRQFGYSLSGQPIASDPKTSRLIVNNGQVFSYSWTISPYM
ncbi:hypothetical protein P9112_009982 [Eukaryota sp. TZLM1-RC]